MESNGRKCTLVWVGQPQIDHCGHRWSISGAAECGGDVNNEAEGE